MQELEATATTSWPARSPVRRTRIVALLFPADVQRLSRIALEIFMSAATRASELGYHLVLWPTGTSPDDLSDLVSGGLVDGVIVMEVRMDDPRIRELAALDVPFTSPSAARRTARPAVRRHGLRAHGRRRHRPPAGPRPPPVRARAGGPRRQPMGGYAPTTRRGRRSCGRSPRAASAARSSAPRRSEGGRAAAGELLEAAPDVTAVLIMKDDSSAGLLVGLYAAGRRVPEDVSVLSVASSGAAGDQHYPRLSTMVAPGRALGTRAADALIEQLDGTSVELPHFLLPCVLRVAESTAPVSAGASATA